MTGGLQQRMVLCALMLVVSTAQGAQAPIYDTQWWQEVDLAGTLSEHLAYDVTGVSRLSDNNPNSALTGGGAFISWKQAAFTYTAGYVHAELRNSSNGSRLDADLPLGAIAGTWRVADRVAVTDQLRIEELYGVPKNPWRYRNLGLLSCALHRFKPVKAIMVSDEIFIDLNSQRLTRNRLLAGPVFAIARQVDMTLDYVNERDIGKRPGRIQGALVDLTVYFGR